MSQSASHLRHIHVKFTSYTRHLQVVVVKSENSSCPPTSASKPRDDASLVKRDANDDVSNDDVAKDVTAATTTTTTTTTATVGPGTKFENAFLQYLAKHTSTPTTTTANQVSQAEGLF